MEPMINQGRINGKNKEKETIGIGKDLGETTKSDTSGREKKINIPLVVEGLIAGA